MIPLKGLPLTGLIGGESVLELRDLLLGTDIGEAASNREKNYLLT